MSRYARQTALLEFGFQGQAALKKAHVLIIGAGGLASPVLQYLVGAGLGKITLIDHDIVSVSNLHRQTLFRMDDLGQSKAERAAIHMAALNPDCRIVPKRTRLDPQNAENLIETADLVLDCADSFAASYIASDVCFARNIPLIHASITGMSGYCGGFCSNAPSLRSVFPDLPTRMGSCEQNGVLGPSVGVVGSLQAQMAIAVLTNADPSPMGQLITYNAGAMRFGGFRFDNAQEPTIKHTFVAENDLSQGDLIIDLRGPEEPGPQIVAIRSDVQQVTQTLQEITHSMLKPPERVVLACRSGLRAWTAAEQISNIWTGKIALIALGD